MDGVNSKHGAAAAADDELLLALALQGGEGEEEGGEGLASHSLLQIRNADQYEESVIRAAELNNTPRLMMQNNNQNNNNTQAKEAATRSSSSLQRPSTTTTTTTVFGFPPLDGLVPSRRLHEVDLGQVRTVLRRLRRTPTQPNNNSNTTPPPPPAVGVLLDPHACLKEQLLLSLLQSASGDGEMGVFPQLEAKQEYQRQQRARRRRRRRADDGDTADNRSNPNKHRNSIHPSKQVGDQNQDDDDDDADDSRAGSMTRRQEAATPEGRLEGIKQGRRHRSEGQHKKKKNGGQPKSVCFAQDETEEDHPRSMPFQQQPRSLLVNKIVKIPPQSYNADGRRSHNNKRRRRISIQERKRRQDQPQHGGDDDNVDDGVNTTDLESSNNTGEVDLRTAIVNQLKEQRLERERRRKQRDKAWRKDEDDTSDDNTNDDSTSDSNNDDTNLSDNDNDDNDDDDEEEFDECTVTGMQDIQNGTGTKIGIKDKQQSSSSSIKSNSLQQQQYLDTTNTSCSTNTIRCPLCNELIDVPELSSTDTDNKITNTIKTEEGSEQQPIPVEDDAEDKHNDDAETPNSAAHRDAVLAHHMSVCQTQRRSVRRTRQRQGGRASAASGVVAAHSDTTIERRNRGRNPRTSGGVPRPNYAERDDDTTTTNNDNDDDDDDAYQSDKELHREENNDFNDDDDLVDCDDDVVMDIDDNDKEIIKAGKITQQSKTKKRRRRRRRRPSSSSKKKSPPLDDWYQEDYEDRVYNWIDHGLERMVVMEERDANEVPPGEEEYGNDGVGSSSSSALIIPAWINNRLFPYQRTGLRWLWELHRQQAGGILGDEMGLGKTIQVASFLGSMAASRKMKAILIISPATMLQHWLKEMAKWAPGIRRILIHQSGDDKSSTVTSSFLRKTMRQHKITNSLLTGAAEWLKKSRRDRLYEIIDEDDLETRDPSSFCGTAYAFVTTYENLRRNEDIWTNHPWSYVVIDEAQKIRNPVADITLVCKKLKTPHRIAMSGTPIQNDLRELWSIFDFVFPGRLGTLPSFEIEFATPIKRGGYSNASRMAVQLSYRCTLILKDLINPYLLRRLKKDIKEVQRMPGKREQVLFCRLSSQQRSMYEDFLQSDYVKKVISGRAQLLGAITVMRKICNHPNLISDANDASSASFIQEDPWCSHIDESKESCARDCGKNVNNGQDSSVDYDKAMVQSSGKLEILAKILPLWKKQGHRVLIFCQWKKMIDIILTFVTSKGWKFGRLDGDTNVGSRQRLVDTFNSDESFFGMVCTTRTGGVGLNLVGANRIILYDPDWNPQTDAQARERAWRFGQKREVVVFRMICAGTVEEKIYQRQIFKTALSNSVLQNSKQRRLFTQKDLKDLFSLKADNGSIVSGGEGVTETSELTKGDGFVDPDDENATKGNHQDEGETMRTVMKSKGLAGIFDHDIVEGGGNTKDKKTSVREMEARAKQLAREALQNLRKSVEQDQKSLFKNRGSRFGGTSAQSNSLLVSIENRNAEITNATSMTTPDETKQNLQLLKDLHDFLKNKNPTTGEILNKFSSQASTLDAALFRKLLKSIATLNDGNWNLK